MLELPDALRSELKRPLGELYTDPPALLTAVDTHADGAAPLISVGDVVTAHLVAAGRQPDVAVIDGRTEREPVDSEIEATLDGLAGRQITVSNPPATISEELLHALREAIQADDASTIQADDASTIQADEHVTISVDGEEDLAALPAILLADTGGSVVYGQPAEGMVHVAVDASVAATARDLLAQFAGDTDRALSICDGAGDA